MSFVDRRREPPSFNKSSCTLSLVSIDEDDVFYSDGDKSISFPAPQSHDEDDRSEDDSIFLDELDSSSQHSGSQRSVIKTDQIVTTETRQIWCLSAFTKCVLVLATGLTAFAIFYNLRWEENQRFESMFHDHAAKTIDGIQSEFKHTVDALDNLGVTYTSHARVSGSQFPLVTLPDFEFRGPSVKSLTETKLVSFLPLVEQAYLASWEVYALVASSWVNDALEQMHSEEDNVFAVARNSNGRRELPTDQYIVDKYPGNGTPLSTVPAQSPTSPTMPVSSPMNPIPLPSPTIQPVGPPTMPPFLETLSLPEATEPVTYLENGVATTVYRIEEEPFQAIVEDLTRELYTPLWQSTPVIPKLVNYNLLSHEMFGPEVKETINTGKIVTGRAFPALEFMDATAYWGSTYKGDFINGEPSSQIYVPVFDDFGEPRQIMGVITAIFSWGDYFAGHLPSDGSESIICVLENACGQQFSYLVKGKVASFLGKGDKHSAEFDDLEESFDFATLIEDEFLTFSGVSLELEFCTYRVRIFPTREMQDLFITIKPTYYTVAVVLTFLFTVIVLGILSYLQEKRHNKVLETAAQTSAVVSSLFPAVVRDRLLQKGEKLNTVSAKRRLKTYLHKNTQKESVESKPIADLFPETTVMFADISGFTAWSSVREPTQVFTLLETIYGAFDRTAKRRNVFKVETIGDCYVAVTGLPDPQEDHAVIMSKFAMECMLRMNQLTEKLEVTLGPDTGDLKMRFGMHSGPVTAGVLRGEKSRFQLFGDTVNTAARMESTGIQDRIQCSQATADLLVATGKSHWVSPREEIVKAKGKGEVQTFWIDPRGSGRNLNMAQESCVNFNLSRSFSLGSAREFLKRDLVSSKSLVWGDSKNFAGLKSTVDRHKHQRLIDYNVAVLCRLLKQIVASRSHMRLSLFSGSAPDYRSLCAGSNPINQVTEAIVMPRFDPKTAKLRADPESIELSSRVVSQVTKYVTTIACMYHDDNPFHNYEHASHVTMSANKLLKRVVAPDALADRADSKRRLASNLHEYTYGITSDPLTHFSIVFAALIHDVDHCGVSNGQLVKEKTNNAIKYAGKSVAEQNSVDLAWELLMEPEYGDLQKSIYSNETEFRRFRNLVVNSVIATDIFDADLKEFRNKRWEKAFHGDIEDTNLMATIVIEHIIQGADVSHTMQHWHIYQKWNERLFREMYSAYRSGRGGDKDPSEGWYKGELWFYDNYVIPLAKKLKECGVFGVASAECLTYALDNRREWESKGEEIVKRMKADYSAPKWAKVPLSVHSVESSVLS